MQQRTINVLGFKVNIHDFGYAKYMYPEFNGNAEFKVNKYGWKQLTHYLRMIKWMERNQIEEL